MAGEAVVFLGAPRTTRSRRCTRWIRGRGRRGRRPSRCSTPRSRSTPSRGGCGEVLPPGTQRLRNAVETLAREPAAAAAYGGNVEGWLQLGRLSGMARRTRRADPAPSCRPGQAADGRRASTMNTTFRGRLGNRVAPATRRRLHRGPRQRRGEHRKNTPREVTAAALKTRVNRLHALGDELLRPKHGVAALQPSAVARGSCASSGSRVHRHPCRESTIGLVRLRLDVGRNRLLFAADGGEYGVLQSQQPLIDVFDAGLDPAQPLVFSTP